jgi:hypothetical protein
MSGDPSSFGRTGPGGLPQNRHTAETDEGWSMAKLLPSETGLPMAVWITENDGYRHDVRIKVSTIHGGRGSWRHDAVSIAVRPRLREIGRRRLTSDDFALVSQWIELNRDAVIDYWDGKLSLTELLNRLRKVMTP